jgi:dUTP pyrophosphatase
MDKNELEEYLKKLQKLEENLKVDNYDDFDLNFGSELENILNSLNGEMQKEMGQNPQFSEPTVGEQQSLGLIVKVKKLDENAVVPSYSKVGDAGMDLTITNIKENTTFSITYGFGLAIEIPKWHVGLIFPRSSVRNQDLILSNCVGVIDSGYRGELQATFKKTQGLDSISYNVGDRGAQIIILPYPQIFMTPVPELSNTERGDGGFGSTGK